MDRSSDLERKDLKVSVIFFNYGGASKAHATSKNGRVACKPEAAPELHE
jgi:hypothetical protein